LNILAMDSSAKATSVAVGNEKSIFAEFNAAVRLTHSQTLMPMMESVLSTAGLSLGEIDYFAVSAGPGSFTGLRIGIGAVKGLAYAAKKSCIAVSTLDALARNLPGAEGIVCAAMDARCSQVYTASFLSGESSLRRLTGDEALSIDCLGDKLEELSKITKKIFLVGDGAELCYNRLKDRLSGLTLAGEALRMERASSVLLAARDKLSQAVDAARLMPVYLRLPQAERMRQSAKQTEESHGERK